MAARDKRGLERCKAALERAKNNLPRNMDNFLFFSSRRAPQVAPSAAKKYTRVLCLSSGRKKELRRVAALNVVRGKSLENWPAKRFSFPPAWQYFKVLARDSRIYRERRTRGETIFTVNLPRAHVSVGGCSGSNIDGAYHGILPSHPICRKTVQVLCGAAAS